MKNKIDCGCEKDVFVCQKHCKFQKPQHTPAPLEIPVNDIAMYFQGNKIEKFRPPTWWKKEHTTFIVRAVNAYEKGQEIKREFIALIRELRNRFDVSLDDEARIAIIIAKAEAHS